MIYLLGTIVLGVAFTGWMWWAAKHAPLMDDQERTCPPYEPTPKR